jgi:tRNA nucleotidyltransferase/poly(A) polymerase
MDLRSLVETVPLLDALKAHGEIYLVGGTVRDFLLEHPSTDFDLMVPGGPEVLARELSKTAEGRIVALSEDEIRFVVKRKLWLDIARARGKNVEEDLTRRDFTINSMAVDLRNPDELIDPHGGRKDLKKGIVRTLSETNLTDDPLRILRAFRFASQLEFKIEKKTFLWMTKNAELLDDSAKERVRYELLHLFRGKQVARTLYSMHESGVLLVLFPELKALSGTQQIFYGKQDLLYHSLKTVDELERVLKDFDGSDFAPYREHFATLFRSEKWRSLLLLSALFHDLGKPETLSYDDEGRTHFLGHDKLSAILTDRMTRRLRFSKKERTFLATLAGSHMYPHLLAREDRITSRALNRYARKTGEFAFLLILLAYADAQATPPHEKGLEGHLELARSLDEFIKEKRKKPKPRLVTGHDLIDLGLEPGPLFRKILEEIEDQQAEGGVKTRKQALTLAKELAVRLEEAP